MVEGNGLKVAVFGAIVVGALYLLSASAQPTRKKAAASPPEPERIPAPTPTPKPNPLAGGEHGGGADNVEPEKVPA